MDVSGFVEKLLLAGLEQFRLFYGQYRGIVTRTDDPEKRGRVQAHVPSVGQSAAPDVWIDPAFVGAGADRGLFWPPEAGDAVWVSFARGKPSEPNLYWGGWFGAPKDKTDVPAELGYGSGKGGKPLRRGFVTRMGHVFSFNEENGKEEVVLLWHKPDGGDNAFSDASVTADRSKGKTATLRFTPEGSVEVTDQEGQAIVLDAKNKKVVITDGNQNEVTLDKNGAKVKAKKVVIDSKQIELGGSSYSVVLGELLQQYLVGHTHPAFGGTTGPPVQPFLPSILSKIVKLS